MKLVKVVEHSKDGYINQRKWNCECAICMEYGQLWLEAKNLREKLEKVEMVYENLKQWSCNDHAATRREKDILFERVKNPR